MLKLLEQLLLLTTGHLMWIAVSQSLHLHSCKLFIHLSISVVWADVVDQRQCFEPHSGVGKGRSFETETDPGSQLTPF